MFEPIDDAPKPQYAQPIYNCHICGKPWVKNSGFGWIFCNVIIEPKKQ